MRTCNLQSFVDEKLGVLKEELSVWDRNAGSYNKKDILHLGRSGIRLLANVFRDSILSKLTTSRGYSDALTKVLIIQGVIYPSTLDDGFK